MFRGRSVWWAVGAVMLAVGVVACSRDDEGAGGAADAAPAVVTPGEQWDVEAPEDHGMDPATLEGARDYAFADGMHTQGVVVVHDGVIVAEWYADDANRGSWAASWSVAKSFTSALIGIAIEDGLVPGVDEPMTTWYPDWAGTDKAAITLRDVLQMSTGLDWIEDYDPQSLGSSDIIEMVVGAPDELAFAAGQPSAHPPGEVWSYSSGDTMLLSGVLEQATGMPVDEYAQQELFGPLGIEQLQWWRDARGHTLTYCCLDTNSREFARFGLLYAREGVWDGEQVVPASWVADSLEAAPASDGEYGYQWWLGQDDGLPEDLFSAQGHDGQFIYVIPSLDLVVVRNGVYVKDPGPPIADPNLFGRYPSDGLVPGRGTINPESWDDADFLRPIVDSLEG